jgi:3'-5' exoribonuclease
VDGFPKELRMLLKHMLLSHHGQYDYGSPKRPKTIEATVLNYLDDMDSKINGIQAHIAKENASTSRWTAYHRLYDRYFFKGNGLDEELEVQCVYDEEPRFEKTPEVPLAPRPAPKQEKPGFSNQPLKALENLDLF